MISRLAKKLGIRGREDIAVQWKEDNTQLVTLIRGGKVEQARDLAQKLLEYVERNFTKDAPEKATTYNNMGMVLMMDKDYELSGECFQETLAMRRRLFGPDHKEVALVLLNLIELYKQEARAILLKNPVEAGPPPEV